MKIEKKQPQHIRKLIEMINSKKHVVLVGGRNVGKTYATNMLKKYFSSK